MAKVLGALRRIIDVERVARIDDQTVDAPDVAVRDL